MAKQIKALKCPQCGSTKKQDVKEDHYICNSCSTEYFLDSDDIHVHVDYQQPSFRQSNKSKTPALSVLIGAAICIGIFLIPLIINLVSSNNTSGTFENLPKYNERIESFFAYKGKDAKQPILVAKIRRTVYSSNDEYFLRFVNPLTGEVLNDQLMADWGSGNYLQWRRFDDGKLYLYVDKINKVYLINEVRHELADVTDALFADLTELSSGIATLKFTSEHEGDGFKIMTNDGKEYTYYPIAKKLYSSYQELRDAREGLKSLLPDAMETSRYLFTEKSSEYPEEKIQLIKYWYKRNLGYPIDLPYRTNWKRVYDYNSRFGPARYEKKLFQNGRITRFENLTPDRLYFDAKIILQDSSHLFITGLPNANPEGKYFLQQIDTKTGNVLWTFTPEAEKYQFGSAASYDGGIIIRYHNWGSPGRIDRIAIINKEGKVIKEIDNENLNF